MNSEFFLRVQKLPQRIMTECIHSFTEVDLESKEQFNIPQRAWSSSEPSGQSCWVSHRDRGVVQLPSLHWNCPNRQKRCGQVSGSSEPSEQSLWPSHFHQIGIHLHQKQTNKKTEHSLVKYLLREEVSKAFWKKNQNGFQVMAHRGMFRAQAEGQWHLGYYGVFSGKI